MSVRAACNHIVVGCRLKSIIKGVANLQLVEAMGLKETAERSFVWLDRLGYNSLHRAILILHFQLWLYAFTAGIGPKGGTGELLALVETNTAEHRRVFRSGDNFAIFEVFGVDTGKTVFVMLFIRVVDCGCRCIFGTDHNVYRGFFA